MAIVQGLIAFVSRSLGRVVSALFGWAVDALFGQTSRSEKLWLSGLVGAAALWPVLVLGVFWPRAAALVVAFVPIPSWVPTDAVRLVWVGLATAVPFVNGAVMAARARVPRPRLPGAPEPPADVQEGRLTRLVQGFSITIGLAAAIAIVLVSVPLRRLRGMVKRVTDVQVPLVTNAAGYWQVAERAAETLRQNGFEVERREPPWWMSAPGRILRAMAGASFKRYIPARLAFFRGPRIELAVQPSAMMLTGSEQDTAWAHGLIVEALTDAPAYQTFDPRAQDIERQIRNVWAAYRANPAAHTGSTMLDIRLREIARDIRDLPVEYEEWQVVYRQALQLDRALRGQGQLLELENSDGAKSHWWARNGRRSARQEAER